MSKQELLDQLSILENEVTDQEYRYRVLKELTYEEWKVINDANTDEENLLILNSVGPEYLSKKKCLCKRYHLNEWFWSEYYEEQGLNRNGRKEQ